MRCFYTYDSVSQKKVLIPGCYGSLHMEDKSMCNCPPLDKSFDRYEKEQYNAEVKELKEELEHQISENERLVELLTQKTNLK